MSEREGEIARGIQTGLDQFSEVDSNGVPVTGQRGKKILNVNIESGSVTAVVDLDAADDEVAIYGSDDGGVTRTIISTGTGVTDAGTTRVVPDNFTSTTITNIETFTNATWSALGKATTTVADDGDLQTIDTDAEALALAPTANAAGAASVKYSLAFMTRWLIKLIQGWRTTGMKIDQTTPGTTNAVNQLPSFNAATSWTKVSSAANEDSGVIKASAGVFRGLSGYNSKISAQFILIFAGSATVPIDGTAPTFIVVAPAQAPFYFDVAEAGVHDATGWSWSNSSTASTKTICAADCFVTALFK